MEQTALSYEIFTHDLHQPLPYEFNTLWDLELAEKYPFFYFDTYQGDQKLAAHIRQTAILNTYFLHFLGLRTEKALFTRIQHPDWEDLFLGNLGLVKTDLSPDAAAPIDQE